MIKIEADSLEDAYAKAAQQLNCSITEMDVEVIQQPKRGLMQKLFKKNAIIVASCKVVPAAKEEQTATPQPLPDETKVKKVPKKEEKPVVKSAEVKKERVSELAPVKALKNETARAKTFIKDKISINCFDTCVHVVSP